uniref:Uncharacterized protein n=2 Tax=Panagrolaimus sp. PS1159 TaxID=55785 RepID=A0AC35G1G3_9BILA
MKLDSGNNYDTFENQYKLSKKNNPNFRQKESTDLELWKTDYGKNSWKKSANSSTTKALSIHISCYENAKVNDDTFNALADNLSKTKFGIGSSKKVVNLYSIALPFEFPRQKDDSMPERMQFQASQKLLNPNLPPSVGIVSPAKIPEEAQNQDAEISAGL